MSFQPVVPFTGLTGWAFLQRTQTAQLESYAGGDQITRETEYFRENIKKIDTAADLVADRTLLKVALGAFGLQDDIGNKYYIQKVLEDGVVEDDALANRLTDKRYRAMSEAMGFSLQAPFGVKSDTQINQLLDSYETRSFEVAVGDQNPDMRLAMALERDLGEIAGKDISNDAKWFSIMGTPPLREVFEGAFQLPTAFGALPIDKQLETLKDRAQAQFGTDQVADLANEDGIETLRRRFLLISDTQGPAVNAPGSIALTLLQGGGF